MALLVYYGFVYLYAFSHCVEMSRKMLIDGDEGRSVEEEQFDYDLFVIGAGSGGVRASRTSAGLGAKVSICFKKNG